MDVLVTKIAKKIEALRQKIDDVAKACGRDPTTIRLCAVTKYATTIETRAIAHALHKLGMAVVLGESRVQDLLPKAAAMAGDDLDVRWDLIGTLQRNKARAVLRLVDRFQSIDRLAILETLDRLAHETGLVARGQRVRGLLQVKLSDEESKRGFTPEELPRAIEAAQACAGVVIEGLMTMAPFGTDNESARPFFAQLATLRATLAPTCPDLSMGMSGDYEAAIAEGATILRIGSALHGA